ncbi:acyl-CoA N-acyltransferase [Polychytrium aggregatum]|uniref:acyl-CoA N-acyltransferase n=1 Tax=Polychytrium aggregatum TaxID=110093 RepID=UPI0022FF06FE|nr:acyl-CoA N-acyltransferase [Polychytrium aggregatum]KAI9203077.1 acyl-CoA N-acyltransferase [Polychytrium aggregatum]
MSWSDEGKRAEMSSKSSRYLFALDRTSQTPLGFVHFQFVMEDCTDGGPYLPQQAAIYCYELQIAESQQGKGIGRQLLDAMEHIGRDTGMRKAMLTTFKSNDRATRFYAHLG